MQHLKYFLRLQVHRQTSYCCGRHLSDHVTDKSGNLPEITGSGPKPVVTAGNELTSLSHPHRHRTPASDLNCKIYQPIRSDELKTIFGGTQKNEEKTRFSDFKSLQPQLLEKLQHLGFEKPLPVQRETLEATLRGNDAVIKSVTGSGKTLAFVLPLLNKIGAQRSASVKLYPQAVIVAPTRELCRQIASVLEDFVGPERLSTMIAGSIKVRKQAKTAKTENKDIIVGTPGRIMQLVSMNIIRPEQLKFLVLDEADELLKDMFYEHVRWILDNSNQSKQMIVTTATVPANVQFVIDRYMKYHEFIDLGHQVVSLPDQIKHKAVLYEVGVFRRALQWVLKDEHTGCSMVFVKYKEDCSTLTEVIREWGYSVKYVNSQVPENARVRIMEEFYDGGFEVLVATDLAARGVDVPECGLVVHVKPDLDNSKYIHRAGRTGRAGRPGTSVLMLIHEKNEHMEFLGNLSDIVQFDYYLYSRLHQYRLTPKETG